ncbi:hypothetical protein STVA_39910 [Allostella vacuolata]|nr:hypothetical protein STVA_39910 [Stella vacuolata]
MTVFLMQGGLRDARSLGAALGWIEAGRSMGFALRIHASRDIPPAIRAATGAVPTFTWAPDAQPVRDPAYDRLGNLVELGLQFAADCRSIPLDAVGAADLIVLDDACPGDIFGLSLWLDRLPPDRRPRVHCQFRAPDFDWTVNAAAGTVVGDTVHHRYAMERLERCAGRERTVFAAAAPQLCAALASIAGRCRLSPAGVHVVDAATEARLLARPPSPHDIAILGHLRPEHGSAGLVEILKRFAAHRPGRSALVQLRQPEQAARLRQAMAEGPPLALTTLAGDQSMEDHARALLSSRIVLLPYSPARYRMRVSGLMAEAAAAALDRLPQLAAAATGLRAAWRRQHSFAAYVRFVRHHGRPDEGSACAST